MSPGKVLVLGASGRLGRMLRAFWPAHDAIWQARTDGAGVALFDPLEDPAALARQARGTRAIICLAGVTPAQATRTGDSFALNVSLARAAVRGAAEGGVPLVLLASSAAVYGRAAGLLHEDGPCAPTSDYGRSKLEMERQASRLGTDLDVAVCSLRIGNVAGADAILGGWREGFRLDRLPDGTTPRRSYIGPVSLTRAIEALSRATGLPDSINLSAAGSVEMGALLDAADLGWSPRDAGPEVIAEVTLATGRLSEHMRLAPEAGTPAGLVAEWAHFANRQPQDT